MSFEQGINWFLLLSQVCVFLWYLSSHSLSGASYQVSEAAVLESPLVFRPDARAQVWRFVVYAFLHAGPWHLALNLLVQLLLGMPLEMVHGSLRCAGLYVGGVLAGSLASSVLDAHVYLVGASGGVYALLAAHLANVMLNYAHMRLPALRLVGVAFIASVDVSLAILDHYYGGHGGPRALPVSYLAHLAGAMAGLSLGLLMLRSFEATPQKAMRVLGGVGAGVLVLVPLVFNLMHASFPYVGLAQGWM